MLKNIDDGIEKILKDLDGMADSNCGDPPLPPCDRTIPPVVTEYPNDEEEDKEI